MKIESHAEEILVAEVTEAFVGARDDVLELARQRAARYSRTGRFERSLTATDAVERDGRLVAHVGSPLASAHAKERGAYITPKTGQWLTFMGREGHLVKVPAVRLPKRPVVIPAGQQFPQLMFERLRSLRR